MAKPVGPLCCLINPTATCRICHKGMCTTHRNPEQFSVCKKNRCLILARREDEIEKYKQDAEWEQRMRERAKELGQPYPKPDTSSNGYRLLKKIENKRKK